MKISSRPFDLYGNDFEKMWRFLQQDYTLKKDGFIWHIGRLGDWKFGLWNEKKCIPSFFRQNAQLWVDGFNQPAGFVLNEDGGDTFFIFCREGHDYLYEEILDWTIQHWGPRYDALKTEVHEYQHTAITQLEQCGFHSLGTVATTREYELSAKRGEPVELAAGFQIVTMRENQDWRGKGRLYADGFQNQDQASEFDLMKHEYSRENPAYDPDLDLSVVTAEGLHVATMIGFVDPANKAAEVEKICSHRQYRRQGLAEAVIRECFQRLSQRGIEKAYIQGYSGEANQLYEKLGPCKRKQWFHYALQKA